VFVGQALHQQLVIDLHDLAGRFYKLQAKRRQRNAVVGAPEDLLSQLFFYGIQCGAQAALGNIELLCGLVDRAAGDNFQDLLELTDSHRWITLPVIRSSLTPVYRKM